MQIKQIVVGLTSAGLLGLTPLAFGASAHAAQSATVSTLADSTTVQADARKAKRERKVKIRIKNSSQRILAGSVKPKIGKRVKVIVQRAKKPNGNYKKSRTFKTKKNGKFQAKFPNGHYYFRLVVKGNKKFKRFESTPYCVGKPGQCSL